MRGPVLEYVTTCAPLRISFVGGGTDLPSFYEQTPGSVLSTAIDKRIYVTVKRMGQLFGDKYRLNYSETEIVDSIDDIRNAIARECLRIAPLPPPLYIGTVADIPASSGLGSSSCFAVALLKALHLMRGEEVSNIQIAEEACNIEINALSRPVGKQDHYASTFGGMNILNFQNQGRVLIEPLHLDLESIRGMFSNLMLFWTGIMRDSSTVLSEQKSNIDEKFQVLVKMRDQVELLNQSLQKGFNAEEFGGFLNEGWEMKRGLASKITNPQIDNWYRTALESGALGGKLCGAGGGGFLLFVAPPHCHDSIRRALPALREERIQYEPHGVRNIVNIHR
jgi:D-glycero-alpha-D-manno-heptose-7-phosphate kinase